MSTYSVLAPIVLNVWYKFWTIDPVPLLMASPDVLLPEIDCDLVPVVSGITVSGEEVSPSDVVKFRDTDVGEEMEL